MIHRIDVRSRKAPDPAGEEVRRQAAELGVSLGPVVTGRIYYLDTPAGPADLQRIAGELLADPVVEQAQIVAAPPADAGRSRIEVHLKPGVMDPVAASTEMAVRDMGIPIREVRTGRAYLIEGQVPRATLEMLAKGALANSVIEHICYQPLLVDQFPQAPEHPLVLRRVAIRELGDQELLGLSRQGHLFLSLAEMRAIQSHYRELGREPTDVELEMLAQTWSEHCVHKTLKSPVELEVRDESGRVIARRSYGNLIKETIFRATMELMAQRDDGFCLSVFADNAGVIAFDEADAVCFKVETHNRPSAIDPYGGSATGSGGVIRDVLGTGRGARPIANTDVFCVADPALGTGHPTLPGQDRGLPRGVIHPRRILRQVVAGVRDYGNRMGIPTLNGAVYFDNRYLGNPLVFCGCVGLIPRGRITKEARAGDRIVLLGGRTGRDGIHGATFSSAELTTSHADEFSHAVQIGNAITEKKMTDVILQAADRGLFHAITDCGAGGLSSAVGEMGEKLGAYVELDKVPLKYAGLRYDEIWISEAQERMVLAVSPEQVAAVLELARGEDVEATVIGEFGRSDARGRPELVLMFRGLEVARMDMDFVHHGVPMPQRRAVFVQKAGPVRGAAAPPPAGADLPAQLLAVMAHPNVASKHWIIRQYDHEVQGGSVIKPLLGPQQIGPSDAAVIRPRPDSRRGVVLACGLAPHVEDPYDMSIASIDEAIRNAVAVGADLDRLAILDNFCWPGTHDEASLGTLARACDACYDAAKAFGVPFISGKDSLHNQFTDQETGQTIRIPPTLLISAIGVVEDVRALVTMDAKRAGNALVLLAARDDRDLGCLNATHRAVAVLLRGGGTRAAGVVPRPDDECRRDACGTDVAACHDVSDGGPLATVAEMCLAGGLGARLEPLAAAEAFGERNGAYVIEVAAEAVPQVTQALAGCADVRLLGTLTADPVLQLGGSGKLSVEQLRAAWRGTLDW